MSEVTPEILDEIIKGCKDGRIKDQERLYNLFSSILFGVCLYYSKDRTEAEDLLHDGFMKIFSNIATYRYKGSFEGWMRKIMINTALEKFRREKHLHPLSDLEDKEEELYAEDTISNISADDLVNMIQNLSPKYRMVFNLYAVEGYSHKEISEMLGISEGTSKSNLSRARTILQRNVNKYFYSSAKQVK
jgi:RNA polymerase sigma-70 factor (ECF subfamily)